MSSDLFTISGNSININFNSSDNRFDVMPAKGSFPGIMGAVFSLDYQDTRGNKNKLLLGNRKVDFLQTSFNDVHGNGTQFLVSGLDTISNLKISWSINLYEDQPFILFRMMVENTGNDTFYINGFNLIEAVPDNCSQVCFQQEMRPLDLLKFGWHDWVYSGLRHGTQKDIDSNFILKQYVKAMHYNPTKPISRRKGEFWSDGWGILTDQVHAIISGLVTTSDQFGLLHVNCEPGRSSLVLSSQADGIPLEPGEICQSEWGFIQFIELPVIDPLSTYVETVARQMKPRIAKTTPPLHWTHWYYYFENITQDQFLENLEITDQIKTRTPYKVFQLDGGYYPYWGDWTECNQRFNLGLEELSKQISSKGFIPGLWLAPFVVDPRSKVARQHPDWLVRDHKGKPIKSGYFYDFWGYALDLSQLIVQEHVRTLLMKLTEQWGFKFIKADFLYAGALPGIRSNPKMTRAQALRKGLEAIREGIGEETFLLGCGCPMGPAIGIVDAMRIGPDTAPNWLPMLWNMKWASPLLKQERSIPSLRNNIRHTIIMSALHRSWWWNDPDCLMVRNNDTLLTHDEIVSNVSLIGMSGGMVVQSDNLSKLGPIELQLVNLLTPALVNNAHPLDLLDHEMPEVYVSTEENACGNWVNVALFNWKDQSSDKILDLKKLDYDGDHSFHVFDFWEKSYHSIRSNPPIFKAIPSHGCKLLRICESTSKATLVGDTLHISQGSEIKSFEIWKNRLSLRTIHLGRHVEGELWFWLPGKPVLATLTGTSVEMLEIEPNIYKIALVFDNYAELEIHWK